MKFVSMIIKKNKLQIIISKKRCFSLSKVPQFSLDPVTWWIANVIGTILKNVKSKLFDETEKNRKHCIKLSIYMMVCTWSNNWNNPLNTFSDVSDSFLYGITNNNAHRIFFIIDQHLDNSTKLFKKEKKAKAVINSNNSPSGKSRGFKTISKVRLMRIEIRIKICL